MAVLKKILRWFFITPSNLGKWGEDETAKTLKWIHFCGYRGKLLRNLYVEKGNGETTEIDLLYITRKGIFVIENKNYSGYIFGSDQRQNWTSTLCTGKTCFARNKVEKYSFYNPIWQNQTHIKYLKKYLRSDVPMFSVIVFSSHCELKQIELTAPDVVVCQQNTLARHIRRIWHAQRSVLTKPQMEELYETLLPLTNVNSAVKKKHIHDVRSHQNQANHCPVCGGKLVLRIAQNGACPGRKFYGCSNYPRCKYTKNI